MMAAWHLHQHISHPISKPYYKYMLLFYLTLLACNFSEVGIFL